MKYDYIIVGSGLYGAVFANEAKKKNKKCLIVEKRSHIGGNIYTEEIEGIQVHKYGAHIFHTNSEYIWKYIGQFGRFNNFVNSPLARYKDRMYNLPFNMNTFYQLWGVITPEEALRKIEEQRSRVNIAEPRNLEEQAIKLVGEDVYNILIKGYTEKQWGRSCSELPASIIRRIPFRLVFDNNYFKDRYQGVPEFGYTSIIEKMIDGVDVLLNTDFLKNRNNLMEMGGKIIYSGPIDEYFDYSLGALCYRSVRFEVEVLDVKNYQGVAVVNYTEREVPFTRIIEHKHFAFGEQEKTVISREYSSEWEVGMEPYYPVGDELNQSLYEKYLEMAKFEKKVHFGGRLGQYKYFDMDKVISEALLYSNSELK